MPIAPAPAVVVAAGGLTGGGLAFAVVILLVVAISVVIWAMAGSIRRMNRNVATGRFQQTSNEQAVRRMERARRNRLVQFLLRPPGSARRSTVVAAGGVRGRTRGARAVSADRRRPSRPADSPAASCVAGSLDRAASA